MSHPPSPRPTAKPTSPQPKEAPRVVDSAALLGPEGVLYIRHQHEVYRLQTTRFGKLILTK